MPGRLAATLAALAVLALAPPVSAANPQLAGLQVALRAFGLYCGPIDGIAGPQTESAVRAFQRRVDLPVDGQAGPRTRAALGPLGRPLFGSRVLHAGDFGWDVSVLQFVLHERRLYSGPNDGFFGAETRRSVRRYQRSLRLAPDGVAGKATTAALVLQLRVPVAPAPTLLRRYVVRPGDNLTALAGRFATTVAALARLNGLDPAHALLVGTRLRVPSVPPGSPAPAAAAALSVRTALGVWAARYGVDPSLARALSWMESGFQADVRSPVGAWGPMQVLPATWDYVERSLLGVRVPRTTEGNVRIGLAYLRHLLRDFGGDERLALAAWYQGELAVRRDGIYAGTKQFVDDVLALRSRM